MAATPQDYLTSVLRRTKWTDHYMVYAASRVLECDVIVWKHTAGQWKFMSRVAPPTSVKGKPICLFLWMGISPRWRMMQTSLPRGQSWPALLRACMSPIMAAAKESRLRLKRLQSVFALASAGSAGRPSGCWSLV